MRTKSLIKRHAAVFNLVQGRDTMMAYLLFFYSFVHNNANDTVAKVVYINYEFRVLHEAEAIGSS